MWMQSEVCFKVHCYEIRCVGSDDFRGFDHIQDTAPMRSQDTPWLLANNINMPSVVYAKDVLLSLIGHIGGV